jgi:archaellin
MKIENRKTENNDWGSIGIGAMIVFIALILVAAVASAVIIQTGEKLQQNAQQTGSDTQEEIGGKISIITAWIGDQNDCDGDSDGAGVGTATDEADNCITLVYELAAGSSPVMEDQVHWSITCLDTTTQKVWGTFDGINTDADLANPNSYSATYNGAATTSDWGSMNLDSVNVDGTQKWVDANANGILDLNELDDDQLLPAQVYMISLKTTPDVVDAGAANSVSDESQLMQGSCDPVLNEHHTLTISLEGGGSTTEILSYNSVTEGAQIV